MPDKVTWAVALKAPAGKKCLYYEPGLEPAGWKLHDHNIDEWIREHLCSQTYSDHLIYNDEPPLTKSQGEFAHAKGVVAWNDKQLGWLIHSTPKWPGTFLEVDGQQTIAPIPQAETEYGQSFVYLTMPVARLPEVIAQLQMADVQMYGIQDDKSVWSRKKRAPAQKDALSSVKLSDTVIHVSKHKRWAKDFYADYLAPTFGPLIQETWMRSGENPTETVLNAEELAWPAFKLSWNERQDHSKFAVSQDLSKPFAAICDVNYMASQKHRGGGGVIIQDPGLAEAFKGGITSTAWVKKDEHGNEVPGTG